MTTVFSPLVHIFVKPLNLCSRRVHCISVDRTHSQAFEEPRKESTQRQACEGNQPPVCMTGEPRHARRLSAFGTVGEIRDAGFCEFGSRSRYAGSTGKMHKGASSGESRRSPRLEWKETPLEVALARQPLPEASQPRNQAGPNPDLNVPKVAQATEARPARGEGRGP